MKNDRRFSISAAAKPDALYTLAELNEMADGIVATAEQVGSAPKTISDLDHAKIWARWNAPKGARR